VTGTRLLLAAFIVVAAATASVAQAPPDLTGTWRMDVPASDHEHAFHGQRLEIRQSPELVRIDAYWTDETGRTQFLPWDLRIGRFGPRRGGDHSRAPLVQARWNGQKLIMVKSPGQGNSAIWILSRPEPDTLIIETISMRGLSATMLEESAIPREYGRKRFVFRRQATEGVMP
jgi:hypothetical protein